MHFGFALDPWNIDLRDIDLLDTDLDLLAGHGEIQISPVNILFVSKTSSRRLQCNNFSSSKMSSRRLQDVPQDVFTRRFQDVFKTSWETKNCYSEDVFKTCLKDVFKTCLKNVFKTSWRPTNVCWDGTIETKDSLCLPFRQQIGQWY